MKRDGVEVEVHEEKEGVHDFLCFKWWGKERLEAIQRVSGWITTQCVEENGTEATILSADR